MKTKTFCYVSRVLIKHQLHDKQRSTENQNNTETETWDNLITKNWTKYGFEHCRNKTTLHLCFKIAQTL